jgi:hypothetical protein
MSRGVFLAEWEHFHDPERSQAWNVRNLARELGVTYKSIEKHVLRAKKDGAL